MRKKVRLGLLAAFVGFLVWVIASLLAGTGLPNLILRNVLAFDKNISDPGFTGKSYEHLFYSDISPSDYLDLYVPDTAKPPPLLILVHGGGFVYNDSQSRLAVLMYQYMRANGYAVASVNYRLAQEAHFPAAVCDVKAAVRWLRANAEQYGYDANRFAIWGESAGGYLACMAAFTPEDLYTDVPYVGQDPARPVSGRVSAVVDFYGILDFDKSISDFQSCSVPRWLTRLTGLADLGSERSFTTQFLGISVEALSQDDRNAVSPTYYASLLQDSDLRVYIAHGNVDITVPETQSLRLYEVLKASLGADHVTFYEMKNRKHGDDTFYTPENLAPVKAFLDAVLG